MAAITLAVGTADTGITPNTSGSFVPASGDFLVVFVSITNSIETTPTLTSSIGGFTFTKITQDTFAAGSNKHYVYVADAFVSDTSSQTVTFGDSGDEGTGSNISVVSVSSISAAGASGVRQSKTHSAGGATTPQTIFDASGAALTTNPVLSVLVNGSNPPTTTVPSGFSSFTAISHTSPDHGMLVTYVNSGFSSDTITWGSTAVTSFALISIELNAAGAALDPIRLIWRV
jgi:hypothetical protein